MLDDKLKAWLEQRSNQMGNMERLITGEMDWAVVLAYLAAMAAVAMIAFVTL